MAILLEYSNIWIFVLITAESADKRTEILVYNIGSTEHCTLHAVLMKSCINNQFIVRCEIVESPFNIVLSLYLVECPVLIVLSL